MIPVISNERWLVWCATHEFSLEDSVFALETCYYGFGIRSRAGTVKLTAESLIHVSYSWKESIWAMGEQMKVIEIETREIRGVKRVRLNWWQKFIHLYPESAFVVMLVNGDRHELTLQRDSQRFFAAIESLGVSVSEESSVM